MTCLNPLEELGHTSAGLRWMTTVACLPGGEERSEPVPEAGRSCQAAKAAWLTRWGRNRTSGQSTIMAAGPGVEAPITCVS